MITRTPPSQSQFHIITIHLPTTVKPENKGSLIEIALNKLTEPKLPPVSGITQKI